MVCQQKKSVDQGARDNTLVRKSGGKILVIVSVVRGGSLVAEKA